MIDPLGVEQPDSVVVISNPEDMVKHLKKSNNKLQFDNTALKDALREAVDMLTHSAMYDFNDPIYKFIKKARELLK